MKRQSLAKGILTATAVVMAFVSCQTTKVEAVSTGEGYNLFGMEAAAYYAKELAETESVQLRYNYCYSLFEGEAYKECSNEVLAAMALYPNYIRFYYLNVLVAEKLGDENAYNNALDEALELNPVDKEILKRKLQYLNGKGKVTEASEIARRLLELDNKDLDALSTLAENSQFYQYLAENTKK